MKEHGSSFSNLSESVETPPTTTDPPVILRIEVNNPQNQPYFPSPSCRYCVGGEGVGGEGVGGDGVGGCGKKCTKCEEEACLEIFFPPTSPGLMWLCRNSDKKPKKKKKGGHQEATPHSSQNISFWEEAEKTNHFPPLQEDEVEVVVDDEEPDEINEVEDAEEFEISEEEIALYATNNGIPLRFLETMELIFYHQNDPDSIELSRVSEFCYQAGKIFMIELNVLLKTKINNPPPQSLLPNDPPSSSPPIEMEPLPPRQSQQDPASPSPPQQQQQERVMTSTLFIWRLLQATAILAHPFPPHSALLWFRMQIIRDSLLMRIPGSLLDYYVCEKFGHMFIDEEAALHFASLSSLIFLSFVQLPENQAAMIDGDFFPILQVVDVLSESILQSGYKSDPIPIPIQNTLLSTPLPSSSPSFSSSLHLQEDGRRGGAKGGYHADLLMTLLLVVKKTVTEERVKKSLREKIRLKRHNKNRNFASYLESVPKIMINLIKLPVKSVRMLGVDIISLFVPLFREVFLLEGGVLIHVIKHTVFFDHPYLDSVGRMILDISRRPIILRHEFSEHNSAKKMDPLVRGVLEGGGLGVLVLGLLREKSDFAFATKSLLILALLTNNFLFPSQINYFSELEDLCSPLGTPFVNSFATFYETRKTEDVNKVVESLGTVDNQSRSLCQTMCWNYLKERRFPLEEQEVEG